MKIIVNGRFIETDNIDNIGEICFQLRPIKYYFNIELFDNKIFEVATCIDLTQDEMFKYVLECRKLYCGFQIDDIDLSNLVKKNQKSIDTFENITFVRSEIIKLWSNKQNNIPNFDLRKK